MAVPFGFSAGDFIAAIGLTLKIGKSLRETNGATTEYRLIIQDLGLLKQILEFLQALQPAGANVNHVNAIRGMALTCLIPLREFANKIDERYTPALGINSSQRAFRRGSKKAQWALFSSEEVSKFRSIIAAKVVSIIMLLGICNRYQTGMLFEKFSVPNRNF